MEKLPEVIRIYGTGIDGLTSTLVKRTKKKAMYRRSDGVYEVFKIKIKKEQTVFGRFYPNREVYPGNEDFGDWAWCFNNKIDAMTEYSNI